MRNEFEVVVAGGGPGGATAALVLARQGRRVLLVDGSAESAFRIGEALPPAAQPLLRDLGLLGQFLNDRHLPCYGNVSLWGTDELSFTDFLNDPNGHGWHVDRARFDALLRNSAQAAGAVVHTATRVLSLADGGDGWRITLQSADGQQRIIDGGWLIDATGRGAVLSRRAGAVFCRDDALIAYYARFRLSKSEHADYDARTWIASVPDGWWYSALVPSGERVVAYLTDADCADRAVLLSAASFADRVPANLQASVSRSRSDWTMIGHPRATDASSAHLEDVTGRAWIAVGDAALALDPLSSQGMMTALYTGLRAGEAVNDALDGNVGGLNEYRNRVHDIRRAYVRNRSRYYRAEKRWRDRPFWHRRNFQVQASTEDSG